MIASGDCFEEGVKNLFKLFYGISGLTGPVGMFPS